MSVALTEDGDRVLDIEAVEEGAWIVECDAIERVRDAVRGWVIVVESVGVISKKSRQREN